VPPGSPIGVPLVHTVHNVLPHEPDPDSVAQHEAVYRDAAALVVHSEMAARELATMFPETAPRIVRSWHGAYTMFPRRPQVRDRIRERLEVGANDTVVMVFGGVRPYKNVDVVLEAIRACDGVTLVVAGWEWGYPDGIPGDRLGRTRALSWRFGVGERVRLLPGPFGLAQTAELFEASDAAILPYTSGSGSGVLLLAMTFGRHVLATPVGGMHEYLDDYPNSTALPSPSLADVTNGLAHVASTPHALSERFAWTTIARDALVSIAALAGPRHCSSG
jgi:glycosyltransferase involved in cell wall biosynthesis